MYITLIADFCWGKEREASPLSKKDEHSPKYNTKSQNLQPVAYLLIITPLVHVANVVGGIGRVQKDWSGEESGISVSSVIIKVSSAVENLENRVFWRSSARSCFLYTLQRFPKKSRS